MNRLKEVLEDQGRKQSWLAEKTGKSLRSINAYCRNEIDPPLSVFYELAGVLEVSVHDLIEDNPTV